jgi:integrase
MNRPRKKDRHLPPCVYLRHGAYYLVRRGQWTRLASDLPAALAEYARLYAQASTGMAALIEDAVPHIIAGRKPNTQKLYRLTARKLQGIFAEFAPEQVTAAHVAQMRRGLAATPSMANRCVATLRLVFNWAVEEHLVEQNPVIGAKRIKEKPRTRRITTGEYAAIRAKATPRLQIVMELCYCTGQRVGDVLAMRREQLRDDGVYVKQAKTQTEVLIAWNPRLRAATDAAKAAHGRVVSLYVVKGRGDVPPSYAAVYKDWKRACLAAGVQGANIHDLRAMSGSDAKREGLDARALLGHTTERQTQTYLRDRELHAVQGPGAVKRKSIRQPSD